MLPKIKNYLRLVNLGKNFTIMISRVKNQFKSKISHFSTDFYFFFFLLTEK